MNVICKFKLLPLALIISINIAGAQNWVQRGIDIDAETPGDNNGRDVSVNANGNIFIVGAPDNDGNGNNSGHIRVYEWNGNVWIQKGNDIDGGAENDRLGMSVDINSDGNVIAAGAPFNNNSNGASSGQIRVYQWDGNSWVQKGNSIYGDNAGDKFGYNVSISSDGNTVAMASVFNDDTGTDAGVVKIYEWNGVDWVQKGIDINGEAENDYFGNSIDLDSTGNILIASAIWNDGNGVDAGNVRIFEWNGNAWVQKGATIYGDSSGDFFGFSVKLNSDGTSFVISAPNSDNNGINSGYVKVFEWNLGDWIQKGNDIVGAIHNNIGRSVDINSSGNIIALGLPKHSSNDTYLLGQVQIYEWDLGDWIQKGSNVNGEGEYNESGTSLALNSNGTLLAIGAPFNSGVGVYAGHVRVYEFGFEVGIQENLMDNINIYPNPTDNGIFTIDLQKNYKNLRISIINLLGEEISSVFYDEIKKVDLNILEEKGPYLVEIITEDNESTILKVLKE